MHVDNFNSFPRSRRSPDDKQPDRLAEELEFQRRQKLLAKHPTQYYRQLNSTVGSTRLSDLTEVRAQSEVPDEDLDLIADSSPFFGRDIEPTKSRRKRLPPRVDMSEMHDDRYTTCDGVLMIKTGKHTAVRETALSHIHKRAATVSQEFALAA